MSPTRQIHFLGRARQQTRRIKRFTSRFLGKPRFLNTWTRYDNLLNWEMGVYSNTASFGFTCSAKALTLGASGTASRTGVNFGIDLGLLGIGFDWYPG